MSFERDCRNLVERLVSSLIALLEKQAIAKFDSSRDDRDVRPLVVPKAAATGSRRPTKATKRSRTKSKRFDVVAFAAKVMVLIDENRAWADEGLVEHARRQTITRATWSRSRYLVRLR